MKTIPARLSTDIHEPDNRLNSRWARSGLPASKARVRKPKPTIPADSSGKARSWLPSVQEGLKGANNIPSRYKPEPVPPKVKLTTAGHPQILCRLAGANSKYAICFAFWFGFILTKPGVWGQMPAKAEL
jgi:hypothetical protein